MEVKELQGCSKENVVQFFDDYLALKGSHRTKFSVHAISSKVQEFKSDSGIDVSLGLPVENVSNFKNNSFLFPLPKPADLSSPLVELESLDVS